MSGGVQGVLTLLCISEEVHTDKTVTQLKVIYYIYSLKDNNYVITSLDAKKIFDNIKQSYIDWKNRQTLNIEHSF